MNIHINGKIAVMYLPYAISNNQYKYIKENIKEFPKFKLDIANLNTDGKVELIDSIILENKNIEKFLMEIVKEKLKIRKKSDENNNDMVM